MLPDPERFVVMEEKANVLSLAIPGPKTSSVQSVSPTDLV